MKLGVTRLILAVAVGTILAGVVGAAPAQALQFDQITRMNIDATVHADGSMYVVETIDVLAVDADPGFDVYIVDTQKYDTDHDMLMKIRDIEVWTPTGDSVKFDKISRYNPDAEYGFVKLHIGDRHTLPSVRASTYVITYTVSWIVAPDARGEGSDRLAWTVIPVGWNALMSDVKVTITGLGDVAKTSCLVGTNLENPCSHTSASGSTATYTQDKVLWDEAFSIVADWPSGTYQNAVTHITLRGPSGLFTLREAGWPPLAASIGLVVLALVGSLALWLKGRDRRTKAGSATRGVEPDGVDCGDAGPVQLRSTPPQGMTPRLAGALLREGTAPEDLTASIFALAVNGYLRMDTVSTSDLVLIPTGKDPQTLGPVDAEIFYALFPGEDTSISGSRMQTPEFRAIVQQVKHAMVDEFMAQGWYKKRPGMMFVWYGMVGMAFLFLGFIAGMLLGFLLADNGYNGWGWTLVGPMLFGIAMMALARRMPSRLPAGTAAATEALKFSRYLASVTPEELSGLDRDVFAEFLPYAISFGSAQRWAEVNGDMQKLGTPLVTPTWFIVRPSEESVYEALAECARFLSTVFGLTPKRWFLTSNPNYRNLPASMQPPVKGHGDSW